MAMQMSCRSYSISTGSLLGSQRQNGRAMLIDVHLSTARSGVKVLVARCFVSSLRKEYLSNLVSTPRLYSQTPNEKDIPNRPCSPLAEVGERFGNMGSSTAPSPEV